MRSVMQILSNVSGEYIEIVLIILTIVMQGSKEGAEVSSVRYWQGKGKRRKRKREVESVLSQRRTANISHAKCTSVPQFAFSFTSPEDVVAYHKLQQHVI